jgi:hypothetical protein
VAHLVSARSSPWKSGFQETIRLDQAELVTGQSTWEEPK